MNVKREAITVTHMPTAITLKEATPVSAVKDSQEMATNAEVRGKYNVTHMCVSMNPISFPSFQVMFWDKCSPCRECVLKCVCNYCEAFIHSL